MAAVVEHRDGEIERLKLIVKKLQRAQFGRRSKRLDDDQLVLALDDLESDIGQVEESHPSTIVETAGALPKRKPLPDHLPREEILLDVPSDTCPCCGGTMHRIGESESEMLDWVPAQLRVIRISRPKYACRVCNKVVQAAAPERPIADGLATPALLAQVLVSKYCDHTPLYRQSQIFARHGVEIERSTQRAGSAEPAGGSRPCTRDCARMSLPRIISSPTIRLSGCSILAGDARRPDAFGSMHVNRDLGRDLSLLRLSICSHLTERPSARRRISSTSRAFSTSYGRFRTIDWQGRYHPCCVLGTLSGAQFYLDSSSDEAWDAVDFIVLNS